MAKDKFISLKEAAKISGYSPDYVGQLIRKGKLPGKQVFLNVAWMTTEEALDEYIASNKNGDNGPKVTLKEEILSWIDFGTIFKIVLGGVIAVMVVFILFLVYILSVSIDHKIEKGYQQKSQNI
jgi:predicted DNA-binding transcriptional regulator AlpA